MKTQLKKGILEVFVLATLKRGDSYGYKIIQDMGERVDISESTLYPILRRLEKSGALSTHHVEHNGRLRKYYHLEKEGITRINAFKMEWQEIREAYDYIVKQEETTHAS